MSSYYCWPSSLPHSFYSILSFIYLIQNITDAMRTICEILTADPEGGPARIPFPLFQDLYKYLAQIDGEISQEHINTVISHLQYDVDKQEGSVQPRNFLSSDCPSLS